MPPPSTGTTPPFAVLTWVLVGMVFEIRSVCSKVMVSVAPESKIQFDFDRKVKAVKTSITNFHVLDSPITSNYSHVETHNRKHWSCFKLETDQPQPSSVPPSTTTRWFCRRPAPTAAAQAAALPLPVAPLSLCPSDALTATTKSGGGAFYSLGLSDFSFDFICFDMKIKQLKFVLSTAVGFPGKRGGSQWTHLNTKSFLARIFPRYTLSQLVYNSIVHKTINLVSDVADQTKPQPQSIIQDTTSFNLTMLKRIDDEQVGRKMTCFAVSEATGAKVQISNLLHCCYSVATGSSSPSSLRRYSVVFSGELKLLEHASRISEILPSFNPTVPVFIGSQYNGWFLGKIGCVITSTSIANNSSIKKRKVESQEEESQYQESQYRASQYQQDLEHKSSPFQRLEEQDIAEEDKIFETICANKCPI
ncbi:hypothetical protein LXL04_022565 [Taraxacum kok-saghyz]